MLNKPTYFHKVTSFFLLYSNSEIKKKRVSKEITFVEFKEHKECFNIKIPLTENQISEVIWPNREGELFKVDDIHRKIAKYDVNELIITYPGSASSQNFLFRLEKSTKNILFFTPPDFTGRVTRISVSLDKYKRPFLAVKTKSTDWWILHVDNLQLKKKVDDIFTRYRLKRLLNISRIGCKKIVEVGLIDPHGLTNVPGSKGFSVLSDVASLIKRKLGNHNLIHIYGYAQGHDKGYPDYNPSELLGGDREFKKAIKRIHAQNQFVSVYLNIRLASKQIVERDIKLRHAILYNQNGKPIIQLHPIMDGYKANYFYVMNPNEPVWINILKENALKLKNLGTDCIQLDHLGGREAIGNPGASWGAGYIEFIEQLKQWGLKTWMQGVSDIFDVTAYEMTYRYAYVLKNGIIRGGTPLGEPNYDIFFIFFPEKEVIIPSHKMRSIAGIRKKNIIECIKDTSENPEGLALYNSSYLSRLEKLLINNH
ncbi:MAG: DUF6259 domain-containing protein [Bacteroidales bacterium]|jgi:hypothetical protein